MSAGKLHPSAPLEPVTVIEERLQKKYFDEHSSDISIFKLTENITYFTHENSKSKQRSEKFKVLSDKLKTFDTFVFIATTSNSFSLSITDSGRIVIPISTGLVCRLFLIVKYILRYS